MPFARPTYDELKARAAADISANLPGADALLRFSNLGVLGVVLAGMANGQYGYLDWIARQATPFTATDVFLEAWAALKDVFRLAATFAAGTATWPGTNGKTLLSGTPVSRGDGQSYVTTADGTVAGGTVTVPIVAVVAGAAGTLEVSQVLTLGTAISGIASGGAVASTTTPGADVEADASLRSRMLKAYAAPAQGGDLADYVNWALELNSVTRAWNAGVALGAGTVQIFFMMDEVEEAFGGFPQGTNGVATNETRDTAATGDQLALANWLYPLRPVTALVYAYAPAANAVAMTLSGIAGASTATKAAIAKAIDQVLFDQAAPGGVTDAQGNAIGIVDLSYIEAAIAAVPGTAGFVITAVSCPHGTVTPSGDGNITSNAGYLATRGAITYV